MLEYGLNFYFLLMSSSLPNSSDGRPDPECDFPPSTIDDALADCLRFAARKSSREAVLGELKAMDPIKVVSDLSGIPIGHTPLSPLESAVKDAVVYCFNNGLLPRGNFIHNALIAGYLAGVRQRIYDGDFLF